MRRRQFVKTAAGFLVSSSVAGCAMQDDAGEETTITETVVRDVPADEDDDVGDRATETASPNIGLNDIRFQRAGQKGLVVAGDLLNESGRAFEEVVIEVTLYDENEMVDGLFDSAEEQETRESLEAGAWWQWATTFRDSPLPEIDYFAVTGRGTYR